YGLLEAVPDHPELAFFLLVDEKVDDRLELILRHVVGAGDGGETGLLEIEGGLLTRRRIVVLKRHETLPPWIEECGIGIERPRLFGKVGKRVALEHRRHAVDLVVETDELESRLSLAEELIDISVLAPVGDARCIDFFNKVVLDQRLLHAADDIDDVVSALAAAGDQHVQNGGWGISHGNEIDTIARSGGEFGPVAARVADTDIGEIDRTGG